MSISFRKPVEVKKILGWGLAMFYKMSPDKEIFLIQIA